MKKIFLIVFVVVGSTLSYAQQMFSIRQLYNGNSIVSEERTRTTITLSDKTIVFDQQGGSRLVFYRPQFDLGGEFSNIEEIGSAESPVDLGDGIYGYMTKYEYNDYPSEVEKYREIAETAESPLDFTTKWMDYTEEHSYKITHLVMLDPYTGQYLDESWSIKFYDGSGLIFWR